MLLSGRLSLSVGFVLSVHVQLLLLQYAGMALWALQWLTNTNNIPASKGLISCRKKRIHACIRFCMKLGRFSAETLEMFSQAFQGSTPVFEWHVCFKASWVPVEDDEYSELPITGMTSENREGIYKFIHKDCQQMIHQPSHLIGNSHEVCTICHLPGKRLPHYFSIVENVQGLMCNFIRGTISEGILT